MAPAPRQRDNPTGARPSRKPPPRGPRFGDRWPEPRPIVGLRAASALALLLTSLSLPAATQHAPGADLFTNGPVLRLRLDMAPQDVAALRRQPRQYVPATVQAGNHSWRRVAVHLKGSVGSFRPVDDKPSLTLSFDRFTTGQRFFGLRKIHLHNAVEDPSFLHERLGGELFRAAGVPAPRAAHALVELNRRRLGLYVLREGFSEDFLAAHFPRADGNLYEGSGRDVTEPLERDIGAGPDDQAGIRALAAAALEPDPAQRWARLGQTLDVDRFVSFMVMEVMLGHRDGYCLARNNYRLYHDPATGRVVFLPHGMDQLLGRADFPWRPHFSGLVARAVIETDEGGRLYRERFEALLTNVFNVPTLARQLEAWAAPVSAALRGRERRDFLRELAALQRRLAERRRSLEQQLAQSEPRPLRFDAGPVSLTNWFAVDPPAGGTMDHAAAPDGRAALHIRAGPMTSASWRTRVRLPPGRYRFEGLVRTQGVLQPGTSPGRGAGLRPHGGRRDPANCFVGDTPWTRQEALFEVTRPEEDVELLCELRAVQGDAWFARDSLRLARLP